VASNYARTDLTSVTRILGRPSIGVEMPGRLLSFADVVSLGAQTRGSGAVLEVSAEGRGKEVLEDNMGSAA
jgi:hypothetical protein